MDVDKIRSVYNILVTTSSKFWTVRSIFTNVLSNKDPPFHLQLVYPRGSRHQVVLPRSSPPAILSRPGRRWGGTMNLAVLLVYVEEQGYLTHSTTAKTICRGVLIFSRGDLKDNTLLQIEWNYRSNSPTTWNTFLEVGDGVTHLKMATIFWDVWHHHPPLNVEVDET